MTPPTFGTRTRGLLAEIAAPSAALAPCAPPPAAFDGLVIVRPLGRGGMGDVFLADEPALARRVAVKLVRDARGGAWADEARLLASVRSPHVVAVHRVGVVEARPYLVYEYVPGVSLADAQLPMTPRRALFVARDLAEALSAVHSAGVVHADVKPSNVMLGPDALRPGVEVPKLIDFGIAQRTGAPASGFGTPAYQPPEARGTSALSPRADVYSLALVILELLTGTPDVREGPRRAAGVLAAVRASDLLAPLSRALSARAEDRPDAMELWAALDRALLPAPSTLGTAARLPARRRLAPSTASWAAYHARAARAALGAGRDPAGSR